MHRLTRTLLAACCAAAGLGAQTQMASSIAVPEFAVGQESRLQEQSVWGSDWQTQADPATRPTFLTGDGRMLASVGRQAACEPVLQRTGHATRWQLQVRPSVDGRGANWQRHQLRRVRASSVLVGIDRTADLELRSVGFAREGAYWLLLEVVNIGAEPRSQVAVPFRLGPDSAAWTWQCGALRPQAAQSTALRLTIDPARLQPVSTDKALEQLAACLATSPGRLKLDADQPELPDFVRDATANLVACHAEGIGPVQPESDQFDVLGATGPLLTYLRQSRWDLAADILDAEFRMAVATGRIGTRLEVAALRAQPASGTPEAGWNEVRVDSPDAACWIVLHHYWYLRQSRDSQRIRAHWPLLEACVKNLPRSEQILVAGSEQREFAASVLFLHAVACIGGMLDELDRIQNPAAWAAAPPANPPGAAFAGKSLELLTALEQRFWLADEQRFAARLGGKNTDPVQTTADGLLPCWIGMLSTTGNKTLDNLETTLGQLGRDGNRVAVAATSDQTTPQSQTMALVALTQTEGRERAAALGQLLQMATPAATFLDRDGNLDLLATGAAVDAALFGTTGHRTATGPSIDVGWFRCKPMLPPGARRFACGGIAHDGLSFDLWIDLVQGPLTAEEAAATPAPAAHSRTSDTQHERSRFVVALASQVPEDQTVLTVVHCEGRQFQEFLRPNQPLRQSAAKAAGPPMLGRR
ncbi:MAG: hypothetical protein VYE77_10005 [Planctomycetota bacterium]|nr:hypothetical protein [Planctomycetota bacterium]